MTSPDQTDDWTCGSSYYKNMRLREEVCIPLEPGFGSFFNDTISKRLVLLRVAPISSHQISLVRHVLVEMIKS